MGSDGGVFPEDLRVWTCGQGSLATMHTGWDVCGELFAV